jgi:hypothetical protein
MRLLPFFFGTTLLLLCACQKEHDCPSTPSGSSDGPNGPPQIGFWSLPQQDSIVDAEYDRVHDRIVAVTANANRLAVIDPVAHSVSPVDLNLAPHCVSVDPTGNTAVVGHNGWITVVDLNTATVTSVYPIACDVWDVVTANGWCHAYPVLNQWTNIFSMDLGNGQVTPNSSIFEKTHAKLRPGSLQVYGISGVLSPSDLEKFDASGGPTVSLYDSPYHGDYPMGGDLWMSDDGTHIFTEAGSVFQATDIQGTDMLYAGSVPGNGHIRQLDHSLAAGRICSIHAWYDWQLMAYGYDQQDTVIAFHADPYFTDMGSTVLPTAELDSAERRFHGLFCFFNSDGSSCHVLMKANVPGGPTHWAATSIPL